MALPTMKANWNDYYKDEAENPRSGKLFEVNKGPFNQFEDDLTESRKGEVKFQKVIEKSKGVNILLIPTADKQVQVIHSLFTTNSPSNKGNKMTLGIQGLSKISSFLQVPEKELAKPLGRLKSSKPVANQKGELVVPSPKDFASVTSAEEFKKLSGTPPNRKDYRFSDLPNFTFFHPFILVRTFFGQSMGAAQLGCQVIETCSTGYGRDNDKPDEEGVTQGLKHAYDLLLFLWAVERGLTKPVHLIPFLHSESSEKLCSIQMNKLDEWKLHQDNIERALQGKTITTFNLSEEGSFYEETTDKEKKKKYKKKKSPPERETPESRSRSPTRRNHHRRSRSDSSSSSSSNRRRKKSKPKDSSPEDRKHLTGSDYSDSRSPTDTPPVKKKVVIRSRSRSRSRSKERTLKRGRPSDPKRIRENSPPTKKTRNHRRDRSPGRIRGGYEERSPSPRRRRTNRNRNEGRTRRNQNQRDHGDDDGDSSSSSSSSSSDESSRRGRGGRRGDDRSPPRRRRRSPSSSDDESDDRGNRRRGDGDRRRRRNDRRRRRNSRSRSRSRSNSRDRGGRRHDYQRGRRRGTRRNRSRSPEINARDLIFSVTSAIQEGNLKSDYKKSMLANLHSEAADHFKYLSARSYSERGPKLNSFTEKLMDDRNMNKAIGYVASATKDWPGQVNRKGLVEFLTQGYAALDINKGPGGFTVFMFSPRSYRQEQSEEEKKSVMKAAFGDTKIDDDMIKKYTKVDRFIPNNVYEAEVQLEACVCFLELLGSKDGVSSEGYLTGLRYFREHQQTFVEMMESDPSLLVKYFFMLDRIFQKFLAKLSGYYHERHPLRRARNELEGSMKKTVLDMMRGFELGSIPPLVLPRSLQAQNNRHPLGEIGRDGRDKGKGKEREADRDKQSTPRGKENPPWWVKNPNVQAQWCLPQGKEYKDYFSSIVKAHENNIQGWPKLPHHRTEKKKPMCIRYQCAGSCREACLMAHIDPKDIPKEDHVIISNKFKKVFGNYTKSRLVPQDSSAQVARISSKYTPTDDTERMRKPEQQHVIPQEDVTDTDGETNHLPKARVPRPKKRRVTRPQENGVTRPMKENNKTHRETKEPSGYGITGEPFRKDSNHRATGYETEYRADEPEDEDSEADTLDGMEKTDAVHGKQKKAMGRNVERIRKANRRDESTLRKYLPKDLDEVFCEIIQGAEDAFTPPSWLIKAVKEVSETTVPIPTKPPVRFETSEEALSHNTRLLYEYDFDFEKFLSEQADSTLGYGSEFRPVEQLEKVIGDHPNFPFFRDIIQNGMQYHFKKPLSEEERKSELEEQVQRGNHKSAQEQAEVAERLLKKDVAHGFAMPIHADAIKDLKGAMVEPCGVANQFKLQSDGSRELAARLTHDLSYSITMDDASVNSRIDMEQYVEMIYGWCLTRVIHFIVALRLAHPNKSIFIAKYDYSDAYRRVAHAASAAVQTILIVGKIAYIMLRLAFGGSPNPPTWCAFSEMVTDLSNEIDLCQDWDPSELHSPVQQETPSPQQLGPEIPFAEAKNLAVNIPIAVTARTDSFIDDLIRIFLDTPRNRERSPHTVPLAIHVTSRPHAGEHEPIQRRSLLSASKLEAEGLPVEIQVVLGWDLDTRRLLVLLPGDKFIAWSCDLEEVIRSKRVSFGDLESLVGRLNHVAYLIPLARHFLHRFRNKLKSKRSKRHILTLSKEDIEDLLLWGDYLLMARNGISMNRITIRQPSRLGFGDSCPYGLGGYSFHGTGWRLRIPSSSPIYGDCVVNNLLEFLALAITLWTIVLECEREGLTEQCILILGDNTSALGWLYKTRFIEKESIYYTSANMIARKIARLIIRSTHSIASQHLKGELNIVADLLSYAEIRDDAKPHPLAADGPDDETLTNRFHSHLSQFIPESFEICPLPEEVLSFATHVLQTLELSYTRNKKRLTKVETECGVDGRATAGESESTITSSSLVYPPKKENWSPAPSYPSTVELNGVTQETMLENVRKLWLRTLSEMPQAIWLRRFGTVSNKAPFTSKGARGFYTPSKI